MEEELKAPFKVGDKIKFKDWDAMIKKYGETMSNQPDVHYGMPREMYDQYKDSVFTVKEITPYNDIWNIETEELHMYCFQSQMFRLVESKKKTKDKSMKKCKFKIGDKVRIRSWDDMIKEYGGTSDSIDVPFHFNRLMNESIGGKVFTIKNIINDTWAGSPVYRIIFKEPCGWLISEQMCELAEPEKTERKIVKDSLFFTEEEQVKILNALEVIIRKIRGE